MYFDLSFTKVLLVQNLAKLEIRNILIFVVVIVYKVQNRITSFLKYCILSVLTLLLVIFFL